MHEVKKTRVWGRKSCEAEKIHVCSGKKLQPVLLVVVWSSSLHPAAFELQFKPRAAKEAKVVQETQINMMATTRCFFFCPRPSWLSPGRLTPFLWTAPIGFRLVTTFEAFLWSAPVAFRRVALETPSRDSNHHRKSVSAGKTNAIPTEPSGRLVTTLWGLPADQRGIEPPPVIFPRRQERRPTNYSTGTPSPGR